MTLDGAFQGHSVKSTEVVKKGSMLLLAMTASLMLAIRLNNGVMMGAILALGTVVVPAGYVISRRMLEKTRQRRIEDRLMTHTRTYLRAQAPARFAAAARAGQTPTVESDIEILARAIDGRKLPMQDFRGAAGLASLLPVGDPVVYDALPRRYAIRTVYERRFADLAATLPHPAYQPLGEILPNGIPS